MFHFNFDFYTQRNQCDKTQTQVHLSVFSATYFQNLYLSFDLCKGKKSNKIQVQATSPGDRGQTQVQIQVQVQLQNVFRSFKIFFKTHLYLFLYLYLCTIHNLSPAGQRNLSSSFEDKNSIYFVWILKSGFSVS